MESKINLNDIEKNGDELALQLFFYKHVGIRDTHGIGLTDGYCKSILFEMKLSIDVAGGASKAYEELFGENWSKGEWGPRWFKDRGLKVPKYRALVCLKPRIIIIYDSKNGEAIEKFDWYKNKGKIKKYLNDLTYEWDIEKDKPVLVNLIQQMYDTYSMELSKGDWYKINEDGGYTILHSKPEKGLIEIEKWKQFNDDDSKIVLGKGLGLINSKNADGSVNENSKKQAFELLEKGVEGWFKPYDWKRTKDIQFLLNNNEKMNEKSLQKIQGAFFTPERYVKISTNMLKHAIKESKKAGYDDYVIIDRCAGSGNLEQYFDKEMFKHLIVGTINEAEKDIFELRYYTLFTIFGNRCEVVDALSKEGVSKYQSLVQEYRIKNKVKKLAIIFLENPPYFNAVNDSGLSIKNFVFNVYTGKNRGDSDNLFIWSCWNHFDTFSYIHYGPCRSWKIDNEFDRKLIKGYLCNRKFFNASEASILLGYWSYKKKDVDTITVDSDEGLRKIKKVYNTTTRLYKNEPKNGIANVNIHGFTFKENRSILNDKSEQRDFSITKKNMLKMLPLWCASHRDFQKDYTEIDTIFKTSDGGEKYQRDKHFLNDCGIWTWFTSKNKCSTECEIWNELEKQIFLESKKWSVHKMQQVKKMKNIYDELKNMYSINGLFNIIKLKPDKNEPDECMKWVKTEYKIEQLKSELTKFYDEYILKKLLRYELLK